MTPLAVELFAGTFGWGAGFVAEGYKVIGFDIVHEDYHGPVPDGCELVLQDVLTLHGSQFRDAAVIVASPPCQAYSYRAMPWKRAKALPPPDNSLFEACFRIQREAIEATRRTCRACRGEAITPGCCRCEPCDGRGWEERYIPLVVENVKGAQRWVGRARWHFGSYYLWGDVPAIMPFAVGKPKFIMDDIKNGQRWQVDGIIEQGLAIKNRGGSWFAVAHNTDSGRSRNPVSDGVKFGGGWWHDSSNNLIRKASSRSQARKAASAAIARIPFPLAQWIAKVYKPEDR